MRNQRLIIVIILSLFFSISTAQDKFNSYRELKKIPNGMNIIHDNNKTRAIVGIHGFYPVYWPDIHHEWVQPFNFLVKEDIKTFFYKYDWNECPSKVAKEFSIELFKKKKKPFLTDSILDPINYGFTESINRYRALRKKISRSR